MDIVLAGVGGLEWAIPPQPLCLREAWRLTLLSFPPFLCWLFLFPLLLLRQASFLRSWAERAVPACPCQPVWFQPPPALLRVGREQEQARVPGAQRVGLLVTLPSAPSASAGTPNWTVPQEGDREGTRRWLLQTVLQGSKQPVPTLAAGAQCPWLSGLPHSPLRPQFALGPHCPSGILPTFIPFSFFLYMAREKTGPGSPPLICLGSDPA